MAGNRFRMNAHRTAQSTFSQSTIVLSGSHILTGSAAGTVIGTLSLSGGYSGPVTWSLDDDAGGTIALDGVTLKAGATPTDFGANPTLSPVVRATAGAESLTSAVTITVDNTASPTDFTIKPTGQALIDLSVILAPISELDTITLAVDGPVTADVWLVEQVADGETKSFVKRELVNMLSAVTVGAPIGAPVATWTLGWTGGSQEVTFATSFEPVLTFDIGAKTQARYGGPLVSDLGSGTWTIATQSTTDAFEIFGGRLVWKAAGSPANNSYGASKVITSPTIGDAAYTVDLTNGTTTRTITFNVRANTWGIAPTPTTGVNAMDDNDRNTWQFYNIHRQALNFGDHVIAETGTYKTVTTNGALFNIRAATTRTQRSGGPSAPVNGSGDGWITIRSREYLGAVFPHYTRFDHQDMSLGTYMSYENIWFSGACQHFASAGGKTVKWLRYRFCRSPSIAMAGSEDNGDFNIHLHDNDFTAARFQSYMTAADVEIIGNRFDGGDEDNVKHAIYNTVYGSGYSKYWWNFHRNKKQWNGSSDTPHPDYFQGNYTAVTAPKMVGTNHEAPSCIGNIWTRGDGFNNFTRFGEGGKEAYGGQGFYCNDPNGKFFLLKVAGNIYIDGMNAGISHKNPLTGSVCNYNTIMRDWSVTNPTTVGNSAWGNPVIAFDGTSGGNIVMKKNIVRAVDLNNQGSNGNITATLIDNVIPPNSAWATYVQNYQIGEGAQTIQAVLDAMTPIHVNTIGRGAVANGLIDHRRRIFDPALLATS